MTGVPYYEGEKVVGVGDGDGDEQRECNGEDKPFEPTAGSAQTPVTAFCDVVTASSCEVTPAISSCWTVPKHQQVAVQKKR